MDENRDKDKLTKLIPSQGTGQTHREISLDVFKSAYIAEGLTPEAMSQRFYLSLPQVQRIIDDHNLAELRRAYIRTGIAKIQNEQLNQAEQLLNLEISFKRLRLIQLQKKLEDYAAYYARHGDFYKRHPVSGEILIDTDGIPMQLPLPSVTREITQLKESVSLSDGLEKLLIKIDSIINAKPTGEAVDPNVIDMDEVDGLFRKKT